MFLSIIEEKPQLYVTRVECSVKTLENPIDANNGRRLFPKETRSIIFHVNNFNDAEGVVLLWNKQASGKHNYVITNRITELVAENLISCLAIKKKGFQNDKKR